MIKNLGGRLLDFVKKFNETNENNASPEKIDHDSRLIIVSNRLPVTVVEEADKINYSPSSGGVATGLSSYVKSFKTDSVYWVGWPGSTISEANQNIIRKDLVNKYGSIPVFLDHVSMDKFYLGFCNNTIWPLFHYFSAYAEYSSESWDVYKKVNDIFCEQIIKHVRPHDKIWIHDYHLMLLPGLIRKAMPQTRLGFFLHIPFPFFEIFRNLPRVWREEILYGLLGSDVIGFHTHGYAQYFLTCVLRILGIEHTTGKIVHEGRIVHADSFPMGIDFDKFYQYALSEECVCESKSIKATVQNKRIVLSVDRLDYTKGIHKRLLGFELFLTKYPEWQGKVVLMIIIVPSRIGVVSYQHMKKKLDEEIGRINGKFTSLNWVPIVYQYKNIPFEQLTSLYNAADVMLVTPLRDGMNLVSKEYIASQPELLGTLILSEMAGASKELTEALIINPNNIEEAATAIKQALEMPKEEQIRRNRYLQDRIKRYNVKRWADDFTVKLATVNNRLTINAVCLDDKRLGKIATAFRNTKNKIVFLDYDGTLVPFDNDPTAVKPSVALLELINKLVKDCDTHVAIVSGRNKQNLDDFFSSVDVTLVAEHGALIKKRNSDKWKLPRNLTNEWKKEIMPFFEKYYDSVPGTYIEEKEYSICWHYRMADPELSMLKKQELMDDLVSYTANIDLTVVQGAKSVEIRNSLYNKGIIIQYILAKNNYDFILCIGDDISDEDMFKSLPRDSVSIKVGIKETAAKYYVNSYKDVLNLLNKFVS